MNGLDSPFEALAFNCLSYDVLTVIINNIWTWVAVLTAGAVSFFLRVRASSGRSHSKSDSVCFNPDSSKIVSPSSRSDCEVVEPASTPVMAVRAVDSTDGVTRGKFVVYYYAEEERENVSDGEECEERVDDGDGDLDGHAWRERIGEWEMGWYRFQDLTVLDGNVVRLWDSRRKIGTLSSGGVMMY